MGYNVSASAEVTILAGDEAKALRALGNIAWARPVSSRLCEALEELGCESAWPGEDRRGLAGFEWNGKWGDTLDTILDVIAPLAQPGGRVVWEGEDGALWEWRLVDGGWVAGEAHTVTDLFEDLERVNETAHAYSDYVEAFISKGLASGGLVPATYDSFARWYDAARDGDSHSSLSFSERSREELAATGRRPHGTGRPAMGGVTPRIGISMEGREPCEPTQSEAAR